MPFSASSRVLAPAARAGWLATVLCASTPLSAWSALHCDLPGADGRQRCRAAVTAAHVATLAKSQERPSWCWAAVLTMVPASHGVHLEQEAIVREHYGWPDDRPIPIDAFMRLMNRSWTDHRGRTAQLRSQALRRVELRQLAGPLLHMLEPGMPVVLAEAGHAVLLVALDFERASQNGAVTLVAGIVLDSAAGRGLRSLTAGEWKPGYLAAGVPA